jgi:hypothetical protein
MRYRGAGGSRLPLIVGAVIVITVVLIAWYLFFA